MLSSANKIIDFEEIEKRRDSLGRIIVVSGGFDPIHPGHISYIQEAKKLGDTLVVLINGDAFLRAKKGKPFQDLASRSRIVSSIEGVDLVVPFEIENDQTVSVALERLRPDIFAKGGDRCDASTIPEWDTCRNLDIEIVTGVGADKEWSSSKYLKDWEDFSART